MPGNLEFAEQLADILRCASSPPAEVVYANSVQAGNGSVYGEAKAEAAEILQAAAQSVGAGLVNVLLPNLFGEHGRPFYNSVVATFCQVLQEGEVPQIREDKDLGLMHAQDAADVLLGNVSLDEMESLTVPRSVSALASQLQEIAETYGSADIPALTSPFDVGLFNTYRSFRLQKATELPFALDRRADARGTSSKCAAREAVPGKHPFRQLFPASRVDSTFTAERLKGSFVLSGKAEIAMRCLFSDEVLRFDVDGSLPVAMDMPTLWTHKITNTGDSELYTMFWSNDIFDPASPDTFAEEV